MTKFISLYWAKIPQKIRFLIIGGSNTLFSYLIFALCIYVNINYQLSIILSFILGIQISIFSMRNLVFYSSGNLWKEYKKGWKTYIFMLFINV